MKTKTKLDVQALMKTVPEMPLSDSQFAEELRKTVKNISIRPSEEHAAILVYLEVGCSMSKATVIKKCLDRSLTSIYRDALTNLRKLDAHVRSNIVR
jgi:hypothetical protein